jgi:hypothetical protein
MSAPYADEQSGSRVIAGARDAAPSSGSGGLKLTDARFRLGTALTYGMAAFCLVLTFLYNIASQQVDRTRRWF